MAGANTNKGQNSLPVNMLPTTHLPQLCVQNSLIIKAK